MSEFTPLHEQIAQDPETPLLNLQLGSFSTERIPVVRRSIIGFLREDPELLQNIGRPIPESIIADIQLILAELLSNAHRPEAGRHATAVYVWAQEGQVGIGVGDDCDAINGEDRREQTAVQPPDLGTLALEAFDKNFSIEELQTSGLGGSLAEMLATGGMSYSMITADQAAHTSEPRTHKIVRADFEVPFNPALDDAA